MSKLNDKIDSFLFSSILVFGLATTIFVPDKKFSEIENRTLAQKPDFTIQNFLNGNIDTQTENYLSDQFILRDNCVTLKSSVDLILGKREFNDVFLVDGMLIEKINNPQSQLNENIKAVNNLSNIINQPVSLALVPTAAEIYKDKLIGAPTTNQQKILSDISKNLENVELINMFDEMYKHKNEYIYYRTDHHWTTRGAYYGAKSLLKSMGYDIAEINEFNRINVSNEFNGTLYSSSGVRCVKPDSIDIYVPDNNIDITSWRNGKPEKSNLYDFSYLDKKDKYSLFLGGNQPLAIIKTNNKASKLLLVRDSYADSLVPFLIPYFSEIHLFDARYFKQSLSSYVKSNQIDDVIMLFSLKNFITDTNLPIVCK